MHLPSAPINHDLVEEDYVVGSEYLFLPPPPLPPPPPPVHLDCEFLAQLDKNCNDGEEKLVDMYRRLLAEPTPYSNEQIGQPMWHHDDDDDIMMDIDITGASEKKNQFFGRPANINEEQLRQQRLRGDMMMDIAAVAPRDNQEAAVAVEGTRMALELGETRISSPYKMKNFVPTKKYPFPVVHVYPADDK